MSKRAARPRAPAPARGADVLTAKPDDAALEALLAPELAAEAALLEALARAPLMELLAEDNAEEAELLALEIALETDAPLVAEAVPVADALSPPDVAVPVAEAPPPAIGTPADEQ